MRDDLDQRLTSLAFRLAHEDRFTVLEAASKLRAQSRAFDDIGEMAKALR